MALLDDLAACWTAHLAGAHPGYICCFHDFSPICLLKLSNQIDKKQIVISMMPLFD
jgi:hypothetical protein